MADFNNTGKNRMWARFGTRLSLNYAPAGGRPSEARILDLSGAGVRFRTGEPPRQGSVLELTLLFPGSPMKVRGRVIRVLPCGEEGGSFFDVAVAFNDLTEDEREKIDMWFYREKIDAVPEGGDSSAAERRRSERFEVSKAYSEIRKKGLFSSGRWQRGLIRQLSRHGALLMMKTPFDYGNKVEALLHLPAYDEPVRILAKVVRVKSRGDVPAYGHEIGLEFIKMKKADLKKLSEDEYFQSLIERSDSEFI
jgi:hypothetical protein